MTWKAVGPVVQKMVSRIVDTGEGTVAAEPRRPKRAASTKPAAKSREETLPGWPGDSLSTYKGSTDRCMAIALTPRASPSSAVAIHLVVIEGGGARREGGINVRRLRVSPRSKASELGIYVVG
jgi:hypothetical protein